MTDAQELLTLVIRASEGTIKTGYENTGAGVTYTISGTSDSISFTGVIPVSFAVNTTGDFTVTAKDFLSYQATI